MIRFGICTDIGNAAVMKEIGYDYVELGMSRTAALSAEDFAKLLEAAAAAPLPVESMNGMLPGTFTLCSEEGTGEAMQAYLDLAFDRAKALGVQIVVFGSGGARMRQEGMTEAEALSWLVKFLKLAGPMAAKRGIRIAVEPLRAAECNIINHVDEAQHLAALAAEPNVAALADLYHMMCGNEGYEALEKGVIHCHIAERTERLYPAPNDGSMKDYELFFKALKKGSYAGRVSVEGRCGEDFAACAAAAYEVLKLFRE